MKTTIKLLLCLIVVSCNNQSNNKNAADAIKNNISASDTSIENAQKKAPYIKFDYNIFDFGKVIDGEIVKHDFKFTNTGSADLLIVSATASCGCTVPSYPEKPIKPGESAEIHVEFDSKGRTGMTEKMVTITANTIPTETHITIKGQVLPKNE
ncbi:MAG: DUF1573 domain-containing protein [Bacteroidia bacterium]